MIGLTIIQDNQTLDISQLVNQVTWTGRKGAAGRQITASLLDSPDYARSGIDVDKGCRFICTWQNEELIRGLLVNQSRNKSKMMQITARDNLIYLANNDDTFNYKNKTATQIFTDICNRFQIPYDTVVDTNYIIPSASRESGKLWDIVLDVLSKTYKATGNRYYITSNKGKLNLILRKENVQQWIIEAGTNLIDYDYSKSIENIVTRVKMISDKGNVIAESTNAELEAKIGIFQKVINKDNDLNSGQLQEVVNTTLKIEGISQESLSLSGLGIPSVISGVAIYVIIPELGIKQSYYVDEDSHSFRGNYNEMRLTLNKTNEF